MHMTNKLLSLLPLLAFSLFGYSQCLTTEVLNHYKKLSVVDSAVWLIEKYQHISLKSKTSDTALGQNASSMEIIIKKCNPDVDCPSGLMISDFIKAYVKELNKNVTPGWPLRI